MIRDNADAFEDHRIQRARLSDLTTDSKCRRGCNLMICRWAYVGCGELAVGACRP